MVSKQITVSAVNGFHMRPATVFAGEMSKFSSDVNIEFNNKTVNAKSVMNIIASCIKCGSQINIVCSGEDEQAALDKAVSLIESGLGE